MSRFIDELLRIDRASYQPMGFQRTHKAIAEPRLLIVASMEFGAIGEFSDRIDGANAVLFHTGKSAPTAKAVQSVDKALVDIPWGIRSEAISNSKLASFIKDDCDFVVFPATDDVTTLPEDDKIGKIIQLESSLDDGLLRAVNNLPIDAILINDSLNGDGSLVWHQLMIIQHLTNLLTKPVILPITLKAGESELKVLWEAGVDGVLVEVDIKKPEAIKELRRRIDGLPARSSRKRGKTEAVLPRTGGEAQIVAPPDEEEEEYE